ncbi:MAG: DUF3791 domain-containing protein [Prevotella copri]|nr:DUF3791 domain-containing protein [Segatella copri]
MLCFTQNDHTGQTGFKICSFLKWAPDYIIPSYDVLHTFSKEYLMEDLIDFMKEKGVL